MDSRRIAHRSAASTGGDPNVVAGSIRAVATPHLCLAHAMSTMAMLPPNECPAKDRAARGWFADASRIQGSISGQNVSVISATPAWHTTGTPSCRGAGQARAICVERRTESTASSFHAAPRTMNQRRVRRRGAGSGTGESFSFVRSGFAVSQSSGSSSSSHTNQRVHSVFPCALSTNPSRVTQGSTSPFLYTYDDRRTAADVRSRSRLEMSGAGSAASEALADAFSSRVPADEAARTYRVCAGEPRGRAHPREGRRERNDVRTRGDAATRTSADMAAGPGSARSRTI